MTVLPPCWRVVLRLWGTRYGCDSGCALHGGGPAGMWLAAKAPSHPPPASAHSLLLCYTCDGELRSALLARVVDGSILRPS
eukprot:13448732-Alexandrium_andersonii.AAC.1